MKAATVGIYLFGGLTAVPGIAAIVKPSALPSPWTPTSAIAGSAVGLGGLYIGMKAWTKHPFFGAVIGGLLGGFIFGLAMPLVFKTSDSTGRAGVGLPDPNTGNALNDADIAATQAASMKEDKLAIPGADIA